MTANKSSLRLFISAAVVAGLVLATSAYIYIGKLPALQHLLGVTPKSGSLAINAGNECAAPTAAQSKEIYFVSCGGFF